MAASAPGRFRQTGCGAYRALQGSGAQPAPAHARRAARHSPRSRLLALGVRPRPLSGAAGRRPSALARSYPRPGPVVAAGVEPGATSGGMRCGGRHRRSRRSGHRGAGRAARGRGTSLGREPTALAWAFDELGHGVPVIHERRGVADLAEAARWCSHAGLPEPVSFRSQRTPLLPGAVDLATAEVNRPGRPALPYSHAEFRFAEPCRGTGRRRGRSPARVRPVRAHR